MDYQRTESCVHVISSGLDADHWTPVPQDTAAMIDIQSRELTRLELIPA